MITPVKAQRRALWRARPGQEKAASGLQPNLKQNLGTEPAFNTFLRRPLTVRPNAALVSARCCPFGEESAKLGLPARLARRSRHVCGVWSAWPAARETALCPPRPPLPPCSGRVAKQRAAAVPGGERRTERPRANVAQTAGRVGRGLPLGGRWSGLPGAIQGKAASGLNPT